MVTARVLVVLSGSFTSQIEIWDVNEIIYKSHVLYNYDIIQYLPYIRLALLYYVTKVAHLLFSQLCLVSP